VLFRWSPGAAEVERERAEHVPVGIQNRRRPARAQAVLERERAVLVPQRVGGDVLDDDGLTPIRRSAAGARLRADRLAVHGTIERFRQAWRRAVADVQSVRIEQQD
jgi:hypothetical protein